MTDALARLTSALREGDLSAVEALLVEDPSLAEARTAEGVSSVLLCLYHARPAMAQLLASRRASLDVFEAAALGAMDQLARHLHENPELVNAVAADGFPVLGLACFFGQPAAAELLVAKGAEVDRVSRNALAVAPIHAATASRHLAIVKLLLTHAANVNARQQKGFTPLHAAAANGDLAIVRVLLEHGADRAARLDTGETPSELARAKGHADVAQALEGGA